MEFNRIFKNISETQEILREMQNILDGIETIAPQDRAVFNRQLQQLEKKLFEKNNDSIKAISRINLVQKLEKRPEEKQKRFGRLRTGEADNRCNFYGYYMRHYRSCRYISRPYAEPVKKLDRLPGRPLDCRPAEYAALLPLAPAGRALPGKPASVHRED